MTDENMLVNFIFAVVGSLGVFFALIFIYRELCKALDFIKYDSGDDRRPKDFLVRFLVKFYVYIFGLSFLTFGVIGFATGPFWFILLLVKWRFLRIWKESGYSVRFLVLISIITVTGSFLVTHVIREYAIMPLLYYLGVR